MRLGCIGSLIKKWFQIFSGRAFKGCEIKNISKAGNFQQKNEDMKTMFFKAN